MREPGTTCRLTYDSTLTVLPGDFIRTNAGSCYRVDAARRSSRRGDRWLLDVTRLEHDAVREDADGVHILFWYPRRKRPR